MAIALGDFGYFPFRLRWVSFTTGIRGIDASPYYKLNGGLLPAWGAPPWPVPPSSMKTLPWLVFPFVQSYWDHRDGGPVASMGGSLMACAALVSEKAPMALRAVLIEPPWPVLLGTLIPYDMIN
jgi:hypothetical protein